MQNDNDKSPSLHDGSHGADCPDCWDYEHNDKPRSLLDTDLGVNMPDCARCGTGGHEGIMFRRFTNPIGAFTHWALCPTNGEPILMAAQHVPLDDELDGLSVPSSSPGIGAKELP